MHSARNALRKYISIGGESGIRMRKRAPGGLAPRALRIARDASVFFFLGGLGFKGAENVPRP